MGLQGNNIHGEVVIHTCRRGSLASKEKNDMQEREISDG